jgi:hypothetical protein
MDSSGSLLFKTFEAESRWSVDRAEAPYLHASCSSNLHTFAPSIRHHRKWVLWGRRLMQSLNSSGAGMKFLKLQCLPTLLKGLQGQLSVCQWTWQPSCLHQTGGRPGSLHQWSNMCKVLIVSCMYLIVDSVLWAKVNVLLYWQQQENQLAPDWNHSYLYPAINTTSLQLCSSTLTLPQHLIDNKWHHQDGFCFWRQFELKLVLQTPLFLIKTLHQGLGSIDPQSPSYRTV